MRFSIAQRKKLENTNELTEAFSDNTINRNSYKH